MTHPENTSSNKPDVYHEDVVGHPKYSGTHFTLCSELKK